MAEILKFDCKDTLLRLALNGDENKILEFDPGNVITRKKFYNLKDEMIKKQQELDSKQKRLNLEEDEGIQEAFRLEEEFFDYLEKIVDDIFEEGTTKMICGERKNIFVLANCIIALSPYFKKFTEDTKNKYTNRLKDAGVL